MWLLFAQQLSPPLRSTAVPCVPVCVCVCVWLFVCVKESVCDTRKHSAPYTLHAKPGGEKRSQRALIQDEQAAALN